MAYILGSIHPTGEDNDYEGFYLKKSEFSKIAKDLVGKKILYEHDEQIPVGQIISCWPCVKTDQLMMFAELDSVSFNSILTKHAILNDVLTDFSLGHDVHIESSSNKILSKCGKEVSVCKKGARPNTKIYAIYMKEKNSKQYIKKVNASAIFSSTKKNQEIFINTMEASSTESEQQQQQEQQPSIDIRILDQLKSLQAENSKLQEDLEVFRGIGKKERETALKSGVEEYINSLIESNPELEQYKNEIETIMKSMVESESATPLVKVLSAAASKSKGNINELEAAFQARKKQDELIENLRNEINSLKQDVFSQPSSRMVRQNTFLATASSSSGNDDMMVENQKKRFKGSGESFELFKDIENRLQKSSGSYSIPKFNPKELGFRDRI